MARQTRRRRPAKKDKDGGQEVPASHAGIPPANPDVKPAPLATAQFQGAKSLESLGRPIASEAQSTALVKLPNNVRIKGERTVYGVCGGKIYDVANGEDMPQIAGAMIHHVPMSRKEVMRVVLQGWDRAAKQVKEVADSSSDAPMKANEISAMLNRCAQPLPAGTSMEEHTKFAYEMGYKMGVRFELLKYPDIMVYVPFGNIQGGHVDVRNLDVKTEIEQTQQPMSY